MVSTAPASVLPVKHGSRRGISTASNPTLILLSFVTIVVLYQHPHKTSAPPAATITTPSVFRAREDPHAYAEARRYDNYPWGRVCSNQARRRFRRRFDIPGRPLGLRHRPKTPAEANGRVLVSHIPREVGDGLGHRMCIMNYELHLAMQLGLAYTHRVSTYGSLTTQEDPDSVERLFGWGDGERSRDDVVAHACARTEVQNDTCEIPASSVVCTALRPPREVEFVKAVYVPHELAECYLDRSQGKHTIDQRCYTYVRRFLAAFPDPNTLFITRPRLCFRDYLYTNFTYTGGWFHDKYWAAHENDGASSHIHDLIIPERKTNESDADALDVNVDALDNAARIAASRVAPRQLTLDPERVHIALHVRRGDFFNYTSRVLIADDTYSDMAARIIVALHEAADANVPVTVHVFSEGVPVKHARLKDNHDVGTMDRVYADELGRRRPPDHWQRLMRHQPRLSTAYGVGRGYARADVQVQMHIATDTVQALHDMLAADFFVGSISGLSVQVVRQLARGVVFLPIPRSELSDEELTVSFDYDRNGVPSFVNESLLYERVADYARENRLACAVW